MPAAKSLMWLLLLVACDKKSAPRPVEGSGSPAVVVEPIDASVVGTIADAGVDAITPDAAPVACTVAAISSARKAGQVQMKAGNYDAAVAALQPGDCFLDQDQPPALQKEIAWRLSDLSFAYFKAGKHESCYAIASAETTPYVGNVGSVFDESDPVIRALEYNAKLCQEAAAKARGKFEAAGKCTLEEDGFAVPTSALDGTDQAACLVVEPGKKDSDEMNECGAVVLVRKSQKGKLSRTKLVHDAGNLADGSRCCNIEGVSFGRRGANLAILVETHGRDCNGGTAASEEQHAYELKGDALELFHSLSATAH